MYFMGPKGKSFPVSEKIFGGALTGTEDGALWAHSKCEAASELSEEDSPMGSRGPLACEEQKRNLIT